MSAVPIIITVPPTRPSGTNSAEAQNFDSIYDKARAIIAEAEANETPIWFRDGTESPQESGL